MPNKKLTHGLDLLQNKITGLPTPSSSSDAVSKSYVDSLTDNFVKTVTDPFENDDFIANSSNMVLENGYIRANRQYQVDQNTFSSATAFQTSNIAYDAGRLKLASSVAGATGEYISNFHTGLTASSTLNVAADFDHILANTWGSEYEIAPASGTIQSDVVHYKQVVDLANRVWHFYQVRATGSLYGWVTDANGNNIVAHTLLSTGAAAIAVSPAVQTYRTLQAHVSSSGLVYVTFWTGGTSTTGRIRTLKLIVNSGVFNYGTPTNTWTSTSTAFDDYNPQHGTIHCVDTFYDNVLNRLHIVYQTGTSTFGASHRVINGNAFSQISQNVVWTDTGAKQISIAYNDTAGDRELGIFFFDAATASAVRGLRYKLDDASYPNGTTGGVAFSSSCFGMGGAVYDSANNRYLLFIVQQPSSGVSNQFQLLNVTKNFTTSANATMLLTQNTAASYGTTTYKDMAVYFENNVLTALVPNNDTANRNFFILTFNATTGESLVNNTIISGATSDLYPVFVKHSTTVRAVWSRLNSAGTSASPFGVTFGLNSTKIELKVRNSTSNWVTVYKNFGGVDDVNLLSDDNFSSPVAITLPSSDTQLQVAVIMSTPNGSSATPFFNSYKLSVNESNTNAVTGTFVSESLISDRVISKATLAADVDTVGLSGTITWRMSNDGGTTWANATPGIETVFANVGNNLKVEGNIAIGSGIANVNSARINSYTVTTTNVVLQSDLYNLQVNLAKMGLQVTTITTANRLGYKNMMIDVFQTHFGVEPYSPLEYVGNTLFGNGSGTEQILTSVAEDADITNVTSIVVIGDPSDIAQGVTYQVRRGNGDTWVTVLPEQVHVFQSGTPTNKVQIRAIVPNSASVRGWAYLYA